MDDKFTKHIPNIFTITRIIFVLLTYFLLVNGFYIISIILVVLASITDFLDGHFARTLNAESTLGAKLDQFADKLFSFLLSLGLIMAKNYFMIGTLILEVMFTVLMIIKSIKLKNWTISTNLGKIKTALLFSTIILAIFHLMINELKITFIIIWSLTTIFQIYANYMIIRKFNENSQSVKKFKKDKENAN